MERFGLQPIAMSGLVPVPEVTRFLGASAIGTKLAQRILSRSQITSGYSTTGEDHQLAIQMVIVQPGSARS